MLLLADVAMLTNYTQNGKTIDCVTLKRYFLYYLIFYCTILHCRTGMAGVPGTASAIFSAVKDVGANVIMISQVDNVHLSCYVHMIHLGSSSLQISCRLAVNIQYALLFQKRKLLRFLLPYMLGFVRH